MTAPAISIIDAIHDPALFRPWFKDLRTWAPWFAFLKALFGLPQTAEEVETFAKCTQRNSARDGGYLEAWLCVGRRGGKTLILAVIAVFISVFRDWSRFLVPGERAVVLVVCTDRKSARACISYMSAMFRYCPLLRPYLDGEPSAEEIALTNGLLIEVGSCNFRSLRSRTIVAAICDEIAFWRSDESANPDSEVMTAIRPAMATIPGAMLLCASSPYSRRGVLWEAYSKHFGKDDSKTLVWQASSKFMNDSLSQEFIDEKYEEDPVAAAAEYGAEFRRDIEAFISREAIEPVVEFGCRERPRLSKHRYIGFCDPSGGSADSMTLAIAHREGDYEASTGVLDVIREFKPPFSPDAVVKEIAETLQSYELSTVEGDRYSGEWVREAFRRHGIHYEVSERPKSAIYREFVPLVNSRRLSLLDHPKMFNQFLGLERRTARSGNDSIDHAPGAHDDLANAAAGALVLAAGKGDPLAIWRRLGEQA